jgi:hypothetical protein
MTPVAVLFAALFTADKAANLRDESCRTKRAYQFVIKSRK